MNGDLMVRIVHQARTYRTLMLTVEETADLLALTHGAPHASLAIGPGEFVEISSLPWHILPEVN